MKNLKQNNHSELIIIAPTQIKSHLSIGNIYDLTIADFYSKARKFAGAKTTLPFLWNINGEPLIKQIQNLGLETTPENIKKFINSSIKTIKKELKENFLNFDFHVRDDLITEKLEKLAKKKYKNTFLIGKVFVNECVSCKSIFGSDPSISICKFCGQKNIRQTRETLYKNIEKSEILAKINFINFFPKSIKIKLENFIDKLPDKYNLILEKNRKYTISYKGFKLDPRFTAIMLPATINPKKYKIKTWIHGDVIKKFDYYTLCYLNKEDCPNQIIAHGILKGYDNKKLRWQNNDNKANAVIENIDKKILRAYFLKFNITQDIKLNSQEMEKVTKNLIKIYVKIGRTLENRNLDKNKHGIRKELAEQLKSFDTFISKIEFHLAFDTMKHYADICWKMVKDDKMSVEEHKILKELRIMFFGK